MGYFFGQKIIQKSLVFLCLFSSGVIYAQNVDSILQEYNKKNDLSQKTIDENKGHLVLFTREKLERMHAKTLKDVFKTTPVIYYHENRQALPDPLTSGAFEPYRSNFIRLYVDGVEITQGWMGSGLMLYGDVNIDFVDHIEFYYAVPSFEAAVEPAYLTVFLYSKDPQRDGGGKLDLTGGSRGYNSQSISYGEQTEDLSYMVNLSHTNAKRETIDNGTSTPLSRDFERTQLFSYIKKEDQIFHLQVMKKNTDSLAGMSWDATPLVSQMDYLNVHMDYGIDFSEHWRAQVAYDWLKTDMAQADELPLLWRDALGSNIFNGEYKNSTYSAELTYKETIGNNRITAGIKGRYKELDSFTRDGQDALITPFTTEKIATAFFQDQYALSEQQLLTLGISYNHISRNGGVEDDSLLQLRLGYIYTSEHWSYKAYLYRAQFALEPLVRYLDLPNYEDVDPQTTIAITQELAYSEENYRLRLMLLFMQDEDGLVQNNGAGETKYFFTIVNYDYDFDMDNKVNLQLYYAHYQDIFDLDKLEDMSGYLSFTNSYENFDFYNGVVYHSNSLDNWKSYFDLTSSVSWNIDQDLTVTLKGDNLLNKAKKTNLFRVDPTTGSMLEPLQVSPIDQRITLELEYIF
ncbi:TonB-dependent receptor plug domain-containing protein [Sulfurovum sp. CS9]|uniref:TonB-dependent receptor plug domain-containing protein n=1 Tax=Sulfurovum sp. CS9 TaxID=3391146 RepID=UPI0039EA8992